jgi:hypothetical protein
MKTTNKILLSSMAVLVVVISFISIVQYRPAKTSEAYPYHVYDPSRIDGIIKHQRIEKGKIKDCEFTLNNGDKFSVHGINDSFFTVRNLSSHPVCFLTGSK